MSPKPGAAAPFHVAGRLPRRPGADVDPRFAALALGLLTALAALLRVAVDRGLWLDEAISISQAQESPGALVQDLAAGDRHPPLHHLLLAASIRLLGTGDLAVRAPSLLAGTLLVPVVYLLGRELHDRRTGLVAAGFTAVAPVLVWYAQEVRGYALVGLFGTLLVLLALRAMRTGRRWTWVAAGASAAAAVATHWFALLLVGAVLVLVVAEILRRRRAGRRVGSDVAGLAIAAGVLALQLVPLGLLAAAQVRATGTGGGFAGAAGEGEGVTFYTVVANASWALWGFHAPEVTELLSAVWPLLMLVALLAMGRGVSRPTLALAWCVLAPVLALGLLATRNPQLFEIRYVMVVVPLVMILLARAAIGPARTPGARVAATAAVAVTLLVGLADQQLNPGNDRRYDYREALAAVEREMRPGDVLLYQPPELRFVLDLYAPGIVARPLDGALPSRRQAPGVVVMASFLDQERYRSVVDRQLGALGYARGQGRRTSYAGVDVWRFG